MAKVIYNGNGAVGGSVPVDSNTYSSGNTVNVAGNDSSTAPHQQNDSSNIPENIVTGNLSRPGATFLYWNTKQDGTGDYHGPSVDSNFAFPNQAGDLTLYAQWAITTGLTNGGVTTHYAFAYDEKLGAPGGLEPARTNAAIAQCENDLNWMQIQFAGVDITAQGITLPIPTLVTALGGGASWWPLRLKPGSGDSTFIRELIIAEVVEMFMSAQHKGWGFSNGAGNEASYGEGLSLFLLVQFQINHLGLSAGLISTGASNAWLNSSLPASNPASTENFNSFHYGARTDYVNTIEPWPGNGPASGCSLLFIYYLYHQLGFSIPDIIANAPGLDSSNNTLGGSCLRGVYRNLTGDSSDPFPYFANLLDRTFPSNQVASIAGPNQDDPWPIASLSFVGSKNTWGHDEINDIISHGGTYSDGIFLQLEGFNRNIVGGTKPQLPTISFGGVSAQLSGNAPAITYQSSNTKIPQNIMFAYDLLFAQPLGPFPPSGETPAEVDSAITILGRQFPALTEFFFLAGADPYFTNVQPDPHDPSKVNVPWLSEDLRVFTATPGAPPLSQYQYPVLSGPKFVENSVGGNFDFAGGYDYIKALLKHLNKTYGNPSGIDPFDPANKIIPQQESEFTADSSVTPFTTINGHNYNNYSFAIARVRLKGSPGSAGAATGVKVFFRLWGTQSADTGWDPASTYLSNNDSNNNPLWPEAPPDNHTIPFFATSAQPNFNDPNDPEFKTGGSTGTGANNQTITINQGDSQWAYFGCFLNVNDGSVLVNNVKIPNALPGTHHCLVAQIAYADAPIQSVSGNVPTPESSDQLAQRNLQVTTSDNPGPKTAHRVPQTFDLKPSGLPPAYGPLASRPDELMIDWGEVPVGSVARIYWPAVSSSEVIKLSSWMYGVHPLAAADTHTIEIKTIKGVTYVPIPQGNGESFAGLFTVDLPQTVKTGQEFNIVVRRIGNRPIRIVKSLQPLPPTHPQAPKVTQALQSRSMGGSIELSMTGKPEKIVSAEQYTIEMATAAKLRYERYIVGSFQVKIPVSTRSKMLPAEETTLAILKARLEAMPKTNRWYPVLVRYIEQISMRVEGLGGNAAAIPPSLGGYRPPLHLIDRPCEEDIDTFIGKVSDVVYDCFGDFQGFTLDDCCERHVFKSRQKEIGEVVLRALKDRLVVSVLVTKGKDPRIVRLLIKS